MARSSTKSYEIDMCNGPILPKLLRFSIPLTLSTMLQLLFNAADVVVVGRYAGDNSLAAVGSNTALINLLTNLFLGLSIGANILAARHYGAREDEELSKTVHTSILLSIYSGILLSIVGVCGARVILEWMQCPDDVLGLATIYLRIYFAGMTATMLYNFGAALLRAGGDTQRPLYFLLVAGVVNVVLNLFFVIKLQMDVAGVALATVISQCISAGLVIRCLMESEGGLKLHLKALKIHRSKFRQIIQVGLPAGMQGAVFSISNVLIQSSVNSFGSVAMAGNTTSQNIEGFIYNAMNAVYQANLSFTSQNFGGKKYSRINRIMVTCLGVVIAVGLGMGIPAYLCGHALIRIYSSDPEVMVYGMRRLVVFGTTYFLCGIMDTMVGSIRGLGYSVMPMCVSLLGACGLRIVWIFTVFQVYHNLTVLYLSYPFTWIVTATAHMICFYIVRRKLPREDA